MEDLERASSAARRDPKPSATTRLLELKTQAHDWVRATEKTGTRAASASAEHLGEWLVACDRIALDCYQHVYMHLGSARSIPRRRRRSPTCGPGSRRRPSGAASHSGGWDDS